MDARGSTSRATSRRIRSPFRLPMVGIFFAITLSVGAAGCSSSSSATSGTSTGSAQSTSASVPSLTVGVPSADEAYASLYVAEAKGYFAKAGVNVQIMPVGSLGLTDLGAGRIDVLFFGASGVLSAAAQGQETQMIYGTLAGGEAGVVEVLAKNNYKSITDLSGKRVYTVGSAGASYGWAQVYSSYTKQQTGTGLDLIAGTSNAVEVDGLLSGQVQATIGLNPSEFASQINSHQVELLVNSSDQTVSALKSPNYLEAGLFGDAGTLAAKQTAVVRLLAAVRQADVWLRTASADDVADLLRTLPAFSSLSTSELAVAVAYDAKYRSPDLGQISPAMWANSLTRYKLWDLTGVNLASSTMDYANRVNMSYLDAAAKVSVG
jgi:ABC-type nitrate/sulfonate/bicarbonate transport system substrate-binding protein